MKTHDELGRRIIEISPSGLMGFNSCPRKFAYNKILINPTGAWQDSDATKVGTAMHEAFQNYILTKDVDSAIMTLAKAHPIELENNSKASQYSLEACTITFLEGIKHEMFDYELVKVKSMDGVTRPAIEVYFHVIIDFGTDCPIVFHFRGYIDLLLIHPITKQLLVVDIKTTTPQGFANIEDKYTYDYQLTSYGIPVNALLGNYEEFSVGIFGVNLSDKSPKTELFPYKRSMGDIEDCQTWMIDHCQRIMKYYELEHFPRNPSSCVSFGKLCFYHAHCHLRTMDEMQMRVNPSKLTEIAFVPGREEQQPWAVVKWEL